MSKYHTTPAAIAAALERAAADLRKLSDVTHAQVVLQINLQAVKRDGTESERIATVDLLGRALTGASGEASDTQYSLPFSAHSARPDADTAVYTGLDAPRDGESR